MTQQEYIDRELRHELMERTKHIGHAIRGQGAKIAQMNPEIIIERASWVYDGYYGYGPYHRARHLEPSPARYCLCFALIREFSLTPYQAREATRRFIKANPWAFARLESECK